MILYNTKVMDLGGIEPPTHTSYEDGPRQPTLGASPYK